MNLHPQPAKRAGGDLNFFQPLQGKRNSSQVAGWHHHVEETDNKKMNLHLNLRREPERFNFSSLWCKGNFFTVAGMLIKIDPSLNHEPEIRPSRGTREEIMLT